MKNENILILGIGNPILTDDAVGILVVRELTDVGVDIEEAPLGGMALLDYILGYDKVILVDAVKSEKHSPGTVSILDQEEIKRALHASSTHDVSFAEALKIGKTLFPDEMPSQIVVVGIEVEDTETFSQLPTSSVQKAIPEAVSVVKNLLRKLIQHPQ